MAKNDDTLISLLIPKKKSSEKVKNEVKEAKVENSNQINDLSLALWWKKYWKKILFLISLTLVVYFNSLDNGLVSDDRGLLLVKDQLATFKYIFADPLSFVWSLVHAPFFALFGVNEVVLRSMNLLMHIGNVVLVFGILTLLSNPLLALLSATLFAVHPLLSEPVVWISGGPYPWYTFLFLLTFLFYILGHTTKKYYYLSIVTFVVGLLTSNRIMTLFPIFYVYEFVFYRTGKASLEGIKKYFKRLIPYVVISIIWGLNYFLQIGVRQTDLQSQYYLEKGIDNPLIQIPFAISNYLQLFLWPMELTFYHSDLALSYAKLAYHWAIFLIFLVILGYSFFKKKFIFFWLSFFIISLALTLTPFRIGWIVAERYVYLGTIGLIVPVAYLFHKLISNKKTRILGLVVFSALSLGLAIRTIVRNGDWQSEKSLWEATVRTTPESPKAHNNIGVIYTDEKQYEKAEKELIEAIRLKNNYGDAYHNLANLYRVTGHFDKAVPLYEQALKINPNLYQSYTNLAAIYFEQGKVEDALKMMLTAQKLQPKDIDIYINLAIIYRKLNQIDKAKEAIGIALQISPNDQKARAMANDLLK